MEDAFNAVDDFLQANYRIGLEDVLCNGCHIGWLPSALAEVVTLNVIPTERQVYEADRGSSFSYRGTLTVNGIAYRFRCSVFVDRGGERFLSDVAEFAPADQEGRAKQPQRFTRN